VSSGSTAIGTVLVSSTGRTLYHFDKDTASSFGCTGSCVTAWPPLTISSGSPVGGSGVTGTLAVRARPEGTQQVTWNGLPLYMFAGDHAPGDTKGDGLGGLWHAAKLSAAGAGAGSATTAGYGGGYSYP
jgi:predicted lipoprotein with Yx(FWY)xxD motif